MLGYNEEDLGVMIDSISDTIAILDSDTKSLSWKTIGGLMTTLTFLQGLQEEGWI